MKIKKKRSRVDFSDHQLTVKKDDLCTIYEFKKSDQITYAVWVTVVNGHIMVTGDVGKWLFSHSVALGQIEDAICDNYWNSKLTHYSTQTATEFSEELTLMYLEEYINDLEMYYYDELKRIDLHRILKQRVEEEEVSSETEYWDLVEKIKNDLGVSYYWEDICSPERDTHYNLKVVYDAIEEINRRLLNDNN